MSESESSKSSTFTRKKLTPFLAHEMIYDYSTGQLDAERRAALEAFLQTDSESQNILKNIESAQAYCAKMKSISIDDETLAQLAEAESAVSLGKRYSSWQEWPETLRWSITAIALSAIVAGTVALVPWGKFTPTKKPGGVETVEVAQIPQTKTEEPAEVAANDDQGSGDEAPGDVADESSGDDEGDAGEAVAQAPAADAAPTQAQLQAQAAQVKAQAEAQAKALAQAQKNAPTKTAQLPPESVARATPSAFVTVNLPQPTPAASATKPQPTPAPGTNASTKLAISTTPDSHAPGDAKARGFVYRAFMTLDNLEELGPKITADVVALGGEKAGEVELGWKRGTGRYYHFALPEENEKKILERLQVYGPVRISKDPHPRVMPQGKVRFILWVESVGGDSSSSP